MSPRPFLCIQWGVPPSIIHQERKRITHNYLSRDGLYSSQRNKKGYDLWVLYISKFEDGIIKFSMHVPIHASYLLWNRPVPKHNGFWSSSTLTNCWFALKLTLSTKKGWTNKWLLVSPQKACKCDWIGHIKNFLHLQDHCSSGFTKNCVIQAIVKILAHLLHSLHWDSFYPPCLFVPDYVWKVPNPWVFLTFLLAFFKLLTLHLFFFSSCSSPTSTPKAFKCLSKIW